MKTYKIVSQDIRDQLNAEAEAVQIILTVIDNDIYSTVDACSNAYDELTEKELKQIEADDQAIQTILFGLPEDIYAAVDSYETTQEIWLRVQQMMKGSNIRI
nr:ribonuclease H-like domain-containing protein [Tanacetum cinerariifolium]